MYFKIRHDLKILDDAYIIAKHHNIACQIPINEIKLIFKNDNPNLGYLLYTQNLGCEIVCYELSGINYQKIIAIRPELKCN